jgi:hypothetical protein
MAATPKHEIYNNVARLTWGDYICLNRGKMVAWEIGKTTGTISWTVLLQL